jgi:hypothetical protein
VLLYTQNFSGDVRLIDAWAILFAAIFGVELLATIGISSRKDDAWDENRSI